MIKLEFWKKLHNKWVSDSDGVPSHIKNTAAKVDHKKASDIDAIVEDSSDDDMSFFED